MKIYYLRMFTFYLTQKQQRLFFEKNIQLITQKLFF